MKHCVLFVLKLLVNLQKETELYLLFTNYKLLQRKQMKEIRTKFETI